MIEAVDAYAHAAGRGHADLEARDEVLVEHVGLVVAELALLGLLREAVELHDGVVELGVGVAELAAVDEALEALGHRGVAGLLLGERARCPSGSP